MSTLVIDIPKTTYERLQEQAQKAGKTPEALTREIVEKAIQAGQAVQPRTAREVLRAAGRTRPLSAALRRRIIPGVTLDEVRAALAQSGGPNLSAIVLAQRGSRA